MLFGGNDTLKAGKTKEVLAVEKIRLLEKSGSNSVANFYGLTRKFIRCRR